MQGAFERFYEQMYSDGRPDRSPGGVLGGLYVRLRRFELHRIPATLDLLEPGRRLLDVGCGDGNLLAISRRGGFREVHGIDVAPAVVARATETCERVCGTLDGVSIAQADLNTALPFHDEYFDAVTAIAVLEHIFDPYFSLAEMRRILAPGGQLIIEVPNLAWLPRRLDVLLGRLPVTGDEEGWDGGHLHYFTFATLAALVQSYGFRIAYMGSTGIFPRLRNVWPSMLGGNILLKAYRAT